MLPFPVAGVSRGQVISRQALCLPACRYLENGGTIRVQGGEATAAVGPTWPLLTKCGLGETNGEPDSVGSSFSSRRPLTVLVLGPLPPRSENAKTACIMGVFVVSRRRIRDLLTRLTGFRGDRLTRQVDHGKSAFG